MDDRTAPSHPGALLDLSPLTASPPFARLWASRAVAGIGSQLTLVAVGLNVFALVRPAQGAAAATFAVSLTGVLALVPTVLAGLYGGMLADAFDRRTVAFVSGTVSWLATLVLATLSWTGTESLVSLYLLTVLTATATTVLQASESVATPRLLPRDLLPAAGALNGIAVGVSVTLGPGLAGVLVATAGFAWCYTIDAVLFLATLAALLSLPRIPPEGVVERPGLASLAAGVDFLRRAPNIRTSFLVDIVAMTFGQPRVLYPAVGAVLLGGGALTVGCCRRPTRSAPWSAACSPAASAGYAARGARSSGPSKCTASASPCSARCSLSPRSARRRRRCRSRRVRRSWRSPRCCSRVPERRTT